jgi:hypothetical protein
MLMLGSRNNKWQNIFGLIASDVHECNGFLLSKYTEYRENSSMFVFNVS